MPNEEVKRFKEGTSSLVQLNLIQCLELCKIFLRTKYKNFKNKDSFCADIESMKESACFRQILLKGSFGKLMEIQRKLLKAVERFFENKDISKITYS